MVDEEVLCDGLSPTLPRVLHTRVPSEEGVYSMMREITELRNVRSERPCC